MIGRTISHYKILSRLGEGGMGVVYKAEDLKLKRTVALKFPPPGASRNEASKKRFLAEMRAIAALDHPNICGIHDTGETPDGRMFMCMSFYEGETLDKKIERGPLSTAEALTIGVKIASGLASAHQHGIVHRDIKPGNVMVTSEGEVKILDFGLAKLIGATKLTRTGATLGTISYMSPEQAKGNDVDARSDVFSLGVVLYELLAGRCPFRGDASEAVIYQIVHEDPDPLSKLQDGVSPRIQRVIDIALQKDPNDRYQSAAEFENDLRRVLDGMEPLLPRLVRSYRFRKVAAVAGVVAAVIVAALSIPQSRHVLMRLIHGSAAVKQLVVLPFENVGQEPTNQAFCDGLMETVTSQLTQLGRFERSIWVVPASEVRATKVASPSDAHRTFGANVVVSGGVQKLARRFRVTLNVIDVSDANRPRQLRSTVIDGLLANVVMLQDTTVARIASMLDLELVPKAQRTLASGGTYFAGAFELYVEGRGYLQRYEKVENVDKAILSFERAVEQDSLYALAYAGLGEAYWRKYRATMDTQWVQEAWANGKRAVELDNQLVPACVTLGIIYSGTGEYAKAVVEFQKALALDPTNAAAYQELAVAYAGGKEITQAEAAYKKAIEIRPQYWGGYYQLGKFYYSHDRVGEAVGQFKRIIELTPDNTVGYNSLGAVYYNLDRLDEAIPMFERAIALEPNSPTNFRAYSNLGTVYYVKGRYADAAVMYKKALELNETSYLTWANLANAYYWIPGRRSEAQALYARAAQMAEEQRKINPKDAWLLTSLAGYYAIAGEKDKAVALTEQALALEPKNSRVTYFAGFTYEQLGQREKAAELIAKALRFGYPFEEFERDQFLVALRSDARYADVFRMARDERVEKGKEK